MKRPILIGLTGSIGMGKSTTARMFADEGLPVWDADEAVRRLYAPGGAAVSPIGELRPEAMTPEGGVDRAALKSWIASDATALHQIERVVHPLVARDRAAFIDSSDAEAVVLDIPLLFETGGDAGVDIVVVVSTDPATQRARVLERPGMTKAQLDTILGNQLPDEEKRARADIVIRTDTLETARAGVQDVMTRLGQKLDQPHA